MIFFDLILTRHVFLSTPVLLFFSSALFLPHLTLTTLPSVLPSAATLPILSICMFSFFPQMDLHYFPGFLLTLCCHQPLRSQLLPPLPCVLLPLLRHCQIPLVPVGWISVHPVLIQMVPNLPFHTFFLLSFCLDWLTLSPSFLHTFLPSFALLFSLPLQPNFLAHPLSSPHIS